MRKDIAASTSLPSLGAQEPSSLFYAVVLYIDPISNILEHSGTFPEIPFYKRLENARFAGIF